MKSTILARLGRPPWRMIVPGIVLLIVIAGIWLSWTPGLEVRDGRHDRGSNAIWLAHGWLGGDSWFTRYNKTNEFTKYRASASLEALGRRLRQHRITTVYPHLCPATAEGELPDVDDAQVDRLLTVLAGIRVLPWIGGPNEAPVNLSSASWRANYCAAARTLLLRHPRFAGVQVNIEPMPDGNPFFLTFLEELRTALPPGTTLSVAAYPPPTRWHPHPEVHWGEHYFRDVARRVDELAVMMYDAALHDPRLYQKLMADWTAEVLSWSEGRAVLLGVPTYRDEGVGYHDPHAENLTNALLGIHSGLGRQPLPPNYAGVAIYCDWEMEDSEWEYFRGYFLKP